MRHHLPGLYAPENSPRSHIAVTVLVATPKIFAAFPEVMNFSFMANAKYEHKVHDLSSHSVHSVDRG